MYQIDLHLITWMQEVCQYIIAKFNMLLKGLNDL